MNRGLAGLRYPATLPYASVINEVATSRDFWPCVLGAIAWQETIGIEASGWLEQQFGAGVTAATCISGDGGHGICQLTSSFPADWSDPSANLRYALDAFLLGAVQFWSVRKGLMGEPLLRCIAAEFNAGRTVAEEGHDQGDVGKFTTHDANGVSYSDNVRDHYCKLITGARP